MATIPKNIRYTIQLLDGSDLFLTSSENNQPVTLEIQAESESQIWKLNDENQLVSNNLVLNGNDVPIVNKDSGSSDFYVVMEGDDTNGYNIQWWDIIPVPDGRKVGYLSRSGSNTKISGSAQKWKFSKVVSKDPGL